MRARARLTLSATVADAVRLYLRQATSVTEVPGAIAHNGNG
jgi:hypothetical protein